MIHLTTRTLASLILIVSLCRAANPPIGLAVASGPFQADNSRIWGNATLFEGTTIESTKTPLQLQLNNGVQMRLASNSRAKVYENHAILEKGRGQLAPSGSYAMEAGMLRISSAAPNTVARVQLSRRSSVIVAAIAGTVRVTNKRGDLVAAMDAGRELAFDMQAAGAAAPTKLTGCLLMKDDKYIVIDQTTNVAMEFQGQALDKELGNRVEVAGAAEGQILKVANLKHVATGGCTGVAKRAGATGAVAAGLSTAAKGAIIGGVAVAATVTGLAASGAFSGRQDEDRDEEERRRRRESR